MKLKQRLARLQALVAEEEKCFPVLIKWWAAGGPPTEADLTAPVDANGHAWVSPYYAVSFHGGSPAVWAKVLTELRADPQYQQPTGQLREKPAAQASAPPAEPKKDADGGAQ
jgi:hypothetical protein